MHRAAERAILAALEIGAVHLCRPVASRRLRECRQSGWSQCRKIQSHLAWQHLRLNLGARIDTLEPGHDGRLQIPAECRGGRRTAQSGDLLTVDYRYHARPITNRPVYPPWWYEDDVRSFLKRGDPNVRRLAERAIAAPTTADSTDFEADLMLAGASRA